MGSKKSKDKRNLNGILSIPVPLFGGHVMLSLDKNQNDKIMDWLGIDPRRRPSEDRFESCCGFCAEYQSCTGGQVVVVHVGDWQLDTLVHELAHAVFAICDWRGIECDHGDRETFCYMQDMLFGKMKVRVVNRWQKEEDKKAAKKAAEGEKKNNVAN